jgi:hypothetical protein
LHKAAYKAAQSLKIRYKFLDDAMYLTDWASRGRIGRSGF